MRCRRDDEVEDKLLSGEGELRFRWCWKNEKEVMRLSWSWGEMGGWEWGLLRCDLGELRSEKFRLRWGWDKGIRLRWNDDVQVRCRGWSDSVKCNLDEVTSPHTYSINNLILSHHLNLMTLPHSRINPQINLITSPQSQINLTSK